MKIVWLFICKLINIKQNHFLSYTHHTLSARQLYVAIYDYHTGHGRGRSPSSRKVPLNRAAKHDSDHNTNHLIFIYYLSLSKDIIFLVHAQFIKKQLNKMLILKAWFYFSWVFTKAYFMHSVTMQDSESLYSREFHVVKSFQQSSSFNCELERKIKLKLFYFELYSRTLYQHV